MFQTRLFVGNLPKHFKENELRTVFSNFGEVTNFDIKSKTAAENEVSKFAFVTISSANNDVEACIKHFGSFDFNGNRLYVTRARESFLERLQRERQQNEKKLSEKKPKELSKRHPIIKIGDRLNPKKRKNDSNQNRIVPSKKPHGFKEGHKPALYKSPGEIMQTHESDVPASLVADAKKMESNKKRMESLRKKCHEFKSKQEIIKIGLTAIDKKPNKKLRFSITEDGHDVSEVFNNSDLQTQVKKNTLFDGDESDGEVNFEIKKQYEGKKGQKVLDLQSRYKSDKRFVLDERFIEDDQTEDEDDEIQRDGGPSEHTDVTEGDEKSKQIKILEDVLGVAIKSHSNKMENKEKRVKPSMGMIRFDPMNPEHAKFVVPIEDVKQEQKKSKKNKTKQAAEPTAPAPEAPKVEVSKEQFYKSEITKEAFEQPIAGFSLRSLFTKDNDNAPKDHSDLNEEVPTPVQLQNRPKSKNPFDTSENNPFVYDSSASEAEDESEHVKNVTTGKDFLEVPDVGAVWKENLFFSKNDSRLKDGLAFFNNIQLHETPKERRELKSVMKKRIYNTERKNQMFKKKIGGRKKSMKKSYKKKS